MAATAIIKSSLCDIMVTLQGPEIRTGFLKDGQPIKLTTGKEIIITTDYEAKGDEETIAMRYTHRQARPLHKVQKFIP